MASEKSTLNLNPDSIGNPAKINYVITKSASDVDLKRLRDYYSHVAMATENFVQESKTSTSHLDLLSTSAPGYKSVLRDKSLDRCQHTNDTANYRKTVYDEDEYVVLNFQTEKQDAEKHQSNIECTARDNETNSLQSPDDYEDDSPLQDDYITLSLDCQHNQEFQFPTKSAVDEYGYEAPIFKRPPTYMALEHVPSPPPLRKTPEPPLQASSPCQECQENGESRSDEDVNSSVNRRRNWKKEAVRTKKGEITSPMEVNRKFSSPSSSVSTASLQVPTLDSKQDASVKPISSFLSARLENLEVCQEGQEKYQRTTSSSNTVSSSCTDQGSVFDPEQWSEEEFLSDYEIYYQEVQPPDNTGNIFDHDYASIDEVPKTRSNKKKRNKSLKKVKAFVNNRSKSTESKPSSTAFDSTPKLHRRKLEDLKSTEFSGTWDTVATPGILKLNNYKDLNKNKISDDNQSIASNKSGVK